MGTNRHKDKGVIVDKLKTKIHIKCFYCTAEGLKRLVAFCLITFQVLPGPRGPCYRE